MRNSSRKDALYQHVSFLFLLGIAYCFPRQHLIAHRGVVHIDRLDRGDLLEVRRLRALVHILICVPASATLTEVAELLSDDKPVYEDQYLLRKIRSNVAENLFELRRRELQAVT